jgi:demethylmenaquinone methyltransferase/2-methoxy-6-polyprenyl-1,4-benzoquinol methylase
MEPDKSPGKVRGMFNGISGRYDLLNHLLSFNLDRSWRRRALRELAPESGSIILDLCGGTGDLSVLVANADRSGMVVCCDFSHGMLERATEKFERKGLTQRCSVLEADGLDLPFPDGSMDGATVGFGVRNFHDLDRGLREISRVLRPGGKLVILEFSTPTAPGLAGLYKLYIDRILPSIGDTVSRKSGPYGYLARSIGAFPDQPTLAKRVRESGFSECRWTNLTGGIVALHTALK